MTHCTVCGAAAREGAKFCTSCGARLVDTVTAPAVEADDAPAAIATEPAAIETPDAPGDEQPAAESTWASAATDEPAVIETPDAPGDEQPEAESAWAPVEHADATGEDESAPGEGAETSEPEVLEPEAAESPEYSASWPTGESKPVSAEPVSDAPDSVESTWSSWSSGNDDTVTSVAPESFATDTDQDARTDESRGVYADAGGDEPVAAAPEASDPMDESHHGASAWESWAPEASGGAAVAAASGDIGTSVRRMLDDLANRIDRLIDPAKVDARGVDADALADQLDRWSSASTDADGLLEVVRAVRTSPRDVDALTRLADRAPDLELLVRHYQAITGSAGEWASKLRKQDTPDTDTTSG